MAVTDLSGDLPWWVRQGAPQPPTAAPGQSGMGWLNYLSQMFAPNPANLPSADASPMSMLNSGVGATSEGFPIPGSLNPNSIQARAQAIQNPPPPPSQTTPALPTDAAPPPAQAIAPAGPPPQPIYNPLAGANTDLPPLSMPARPAGVSASGLPLQPGALSPGALAYFGSAAAPSPSGGGSVVPINPNAPAADASPAGPLSASGGATGVGAMSNPRFVPVDRPNMDPLQRGRGGSVPITTALNLGGLFGGGQPVANPANAPAAAARPVSGALAQGPLSQADVNRLAAHYPGHLAMSPAQLGGYIKTQPWLQNLGGAAAQNMTNPQLAAAIHRPDWYRNV